MKFVLTIGSTATARIDGISAAGADPDLMVHTPSADAEILTYGEPTQAPVVPVSPTGCPTPAVVTRAVRELLGFETVVLNAGTASATNAPTVDLPGEAGADVRDEVAVGDATEKFEAARAHGRSIPDDELVVAETIPGGTTTAMGVLTALGEERAVSSSLPENPLELKRDVVAAGLDASDLDRGDAAGDPLAAVRAVGDPVLAGVAGLTVGALESGTSVTLGGGTQMSAAAAVVRHFGVDAPLSQSTTAFIANDETAGVRRLADALDLDLTVTDPEFAASDHPAMAAYVRGEAKEGVGMGGALGLVRAAGERGPAPTDVASDDAADGAGESAGDVSMAEVRARVTAVYDRLLATVPDDHPAAQQLDGVAE
ncbi:nicotinate mononucleotide-dependent phosphoribosyltransferase CobT [Haloparvum sp. PAK95]|uniref:nicotinate mononucleotide-dependent phosphoribosyltransferase CobT n=1 Tax=Haloparvum sp. PAK95 TaxID=3418962 RepID=UPI003D2F177D